MKAPGEILVFFLYTGVRIFLKITFVGHCGRRIALFAVHLQLSAPILIFVHEVCLSPD